MFDFLAYIQELREKEDKKKVVEEYEEIYWPLWWSVKDQLRYTEYLTQFVFHPFVLPEEIKDDFDRDLLQKLIVWSFSSDCVLEKIENSDIRELVVSVKSGDQSVVKRMSELRWFQVKRLYEIYIEEEMNLHILLKKEEQEKEAILSQRQARVQRWKLMLDSLDKDEQAALAKVEQEGKLGSLYDQL